MNNTKPQQKFNRNNFKDLISRVKEFAKKNPLLALIIVAAIALLVNIIISLVFIRQGVDQQQAQEQIDTSKTNSSNPKPSDFPDNEDLLRVLPEINEFFTADYLPLVRDQKVGISVILYGPNSRSVFDNWIKGFNDTSNLDFIFIEDFTGQEQALVLRKARYAELMELLPFDNELFSIRSESSEGSGIKFRVFYAEDGRDEAIEFIERYNLFTESLNLIEFAPFKVPLDSIGE